MWRRLLIVTLIVLVSIGVFAVTGLADRADRVERFTAFPATLDLPGGGRARIVAYSRGEAEYELEAARAAAARTALPPITRYQGLATGEWSGEIVAGRANEQGIPMVYFARDFASDETLEAARAMGDEVLTEEEQAAKVACAGLWEGGACRAEGDDCSTGDRVAVYERDADGIFACVDQPACHTGIWTGDWCETEGDACPGDSPARVHVYVRDGDALVCEPQERCVDSAWYSRDENACKFEGEACTVRGVPGTVRAREGGGGVHCRLTMAEAAGARLAATHVRVDSEAACYETCVARAGGCGAYSFDAAESTCATTGLRRAVTLAARADSKIAFTEAADLAPIVTVTPSEANDAVTVAWEPFNNRGFEMRYSEDASPEPHRVVAASGSVVRAPPGTTYHFRPHFAGAEPERYLTRTVSFARGPLEFAATAFDSVPADGPFHEMLTIAWSFVLPPRHRLFIRFPDSEEFVERQGHGRRTVHFERPGRKEFECFVTHGDARVYEARRAKDVVCSPAKITRADGACAFYELAAFEVAVAAMTLTVAYDFRAGAGVTATLFVGREDAAGTPLEPGAGELVRELARPGATEVALVIAKDGTEILRRARTVAAACAPGQDEFREGCVAACPGDAPPARWSRTASGACRLACDDPFRPFRGECVLQAGRPCNEAAGEVVGGGWFADGEGACELACRAGYDARSNADPDADPDAGAAEPACFRRCPATKPARSEFYWTEDTRECLARCTNPAFEVRGDQCLEVCPATRANAFFSYNADGTCREVCYPGFAFSSAGDCVQQAGWPCGEATDPNGAFLTDGEGGCELVCIPNFERDRGRCKQICDAPFEGASWTHAADGTCVAVCPESQILFNTGATKKCVPTRGSVCEAVPGGARIADGRGGCDLACDPGHSERGHECKRDLSISFTATAAVDTVSLAWTILSEPGTAFRLVGDGVDEEIGAVGARTVQFDTEGEKTFEIVASAGRGGAEAGRASASASVVYRAGTVCGDPVENGNWLADGTGGCALACDKGFDRIPGLADECAIKIQVLFAAEPVAGKPGEVRLSWDVQTEAEDLEIVILGDLGDLGERKDIDDKKGEITVQYGSGSGGEKTFDIQVSRRNTEVGRAQASAVVTVAADQNKTTSEETDEAPTGTSETSETSGTSGTSGTPTMTPTSPVSGSTLPTYDPSTRQSKPPPEPEIVTQSLSVPVLLTPGAADTSTGPQGYWQLDLQADQHLTLSPIGHKESDCKNQWCTGMVNVETARQCAQKCDDLAGCKAFTFYEIGKYYKTDMNCKLMAPDDWTFNVETYAGEDKRFSTWVKDGEAWFPNGTVDTSKFARKFDPTPMSGEGAGGFRLLRTDVPAGLEPDLIVAFVDMPPRAFAVTNNGDVFAYDRETGFASSRSGSIEPGFEFLHADMMPDKRLVATLRRVDEDGSPLYRWVEWNRDQNAWGPYMPHPNHAIPLPDSGIIWTNDILNNSSLVPVRTLLAGHHNGKGQTFVHAKGHNGRFGWLSRFNGSSPGAWNHRIHTRMEQNSDAVVTHGGQIVPLWIHYHTLDQTYTLMAGGKQNKLMEGVDPSNLQAVPDYGEEKIYVLVSPAGHPDTMMVVSASADGFGSVYGAQELARIEGARGRILVHSATLYAVYASPDKSVTVAVFDGTRFATVVRFDGALNMRADLVGPFRHLGPTSWRGIGRENGKAVVVAAVVACTQEVANGTVGLGPANACDNLVCDQWYEPWGVECLPKCPPGSKRTAWRHECIPENEGAYCGEDNGNRKIIMNGECEKTSLCAPGFHKVGSSCFPTNFFYMHNEDAVMFDNVAYSIKRVGNFANVVDEIKFLYTPNPGTGFIAVRHGSNWSYLNDRGETQGTSTEIRMKSLRNSMFSVDESTIWFVGTGILDGALSKTNYPAIRKVEYMDPQLLPMRNGVIAIYGEMNENEANVEWVLHDGEVKTDTSPVTLETHNGYDMYVINNKIVVYGFKGLN